jgi:DNA-binding response OmpR family regulator
LSVRNNRVALAEDDPSLRAIIREVLEESGFAVTATADGGELLLALRAADPLPSVVLLDLMMPGTSGWDVLAAMRSDARLAEVPIIILSTWLDREPLPANVQMLRKPFRRDALVAAVSAHCLRP